MTPRVAAVITTYFPYSHADVIVTKLLKGIPTDDQGLLTPRVKVTAAYLDQIDARDMGQAVFWRHGVPLYQSIRDTLTAGRKNELAVDGVVMIGEHGDYPVDNLGRCLYPRRHLFEQICGVFAETGQVCPVFCDKHLSYNWDDAWWMYQRAKELGVPFMAGSSVPLSHRRPWLELEQGCRLEQAVTVGYGPVESYGYHTIELQQAMVERRAGGETGVAAVTFLSGDAVWAAVDDGTIAADLLDAGVAAIEEKPAGSPREHCQDPWAYLFEYRDGLRAAVVMLNGYVHDWAFAGRVEGQVQACEVWLQRDFPHAHFNYLTLNMEEMFVTGRPSYPVERTLLSTGMTNAMMVSRHRGERVATPELAIAYQAPDEIPWRTRLPRPAGANLDIWPPRR